MDPILAETMKIEDIMDNTASKEVRFDSPQSQFSPDGMVSSLTGKKTVNNTTTQNLNIQNYRMGKFMKEFSKIGFDGLEEVPQPNGDTLWVCEQAIDNQDFNFYISQANILRSVNLTEVKSNEEIQKVAKQYKIEAKQTYIIIDGKKYFVRMNMPMHFGTGQNNDAWINIGVFILGDGALAASIAAVIAKFGGDAFTDVFKEISSALMKTVWAFLKGVTKACYRFITEFIGRLIGGETLDAAALAGREAAGEAWVEAVEGVTSKTLKYTVVGVILIVGIMLFIEFVLHESYQNTYFYNLSKYDIELDFPYKNEGDYHNLPTQKVEAKVDRIGPGGVNLGSWYNGVSFRYQSDSEFHGIGYTMRFKMTDPKTQKIKKTFSCLFDIPFSGSNSLFASISEPSNYSSFYSTKAGTQKVTQFSTNDGEQEIIVSYDYLDGKHKDPETGNELYLYSSIVVIRDLES